MTTNNPYEGTPFDLRDKTSLVSGACGLLGQEFALALASAGSNLVCVDIRQPQLENLRKKILQHYPLVRILTITMDITNKKDVADGLRFIGKEFKNVDVLVNSAAIDPKFDEESKARMNRTRFTQYPLESWQGSMNVNLTGAFLLTQEICRLMEEKNKGSIIFLGSNYGLVGPDQRLYERKGPEEQSYKPPDYSVCKAGLVGLTRFLATYYAGTNMRVNMLTPSGVFNNHSPEFEKNYSSRTVLRRMARKEEYWGPILFLASDASSYMTGANLIIDGGWTAL